MFPRMKTLPKACFTYIRTTSHMQNMLQKWCSLILDF